MSFAATTALRRLVPRAAPRVAAPRRQLGAGGGRQRRRQAEPRITATSSRERYTRSASISDDHVGLDDVPRGGLQRVLGFKHPGLSLSAAA